jgi:hypothetical protein
MADKSKATTRPESRRGMTKGQIREERRVRSRARQRRRRSLYMFGGIIFAIVFISALVVSPNLNPDQHSGNGGGLNTGGHIPVDPDDGRGHIDEFQPYSGSYSVVPATSGPHWFAAQTAAGVPSPARWGRYQSPLPDEVTIHNLEHGGIGLHYNCETECPELIQQLSDLVPRSHSQFIISPDDRLPNKIAVTAWRHHLYLDEFDEEEIRRFIDEYKDRAPESVTGNSW